MSRTLKQRLSLKYERAREGYAWVVVLIVAVMGLAGYSVGEAEVFAFSDTVVYAIMAVLSVWYSGKDLFVKKDPGEDNG